MNDSIRYLLEIAAKKEKLIIGLMSGTSLDGLDIALCKISGSADHTQLSLRAFAGIAYPHEVRAALEQIVSVQEAPLQDICLLHSWLGHYHSGLILKSLREWQVAPAEVDCIASHGQTIYHAPKAFHHRDAMPNATLQVVDGDHIARETGVLTVSDFRQKHTAAGGQGAPMVALTDQLLFSDMGESRMLLNIGGIANFTYLPAGKGLKESVTTDTGPGNTLINQAMQQIFDRPYDKDGTTAASGTVCPKLLQVTLDDGFFADSLPRTTGSELFNLQWVEEKKQKAGAEDISHEDLIATLTWLSAQTIADTIKKVWDEERTEVYLSGGGMHNNQLVEWIEQLLEKPMHSFAEIGFNPDAKEAVSFAVLANETLSGRGFVINPNQNAGRRVNFGKISLPV